jgi:hypothetical protein
MIHAERHDIQGQSQKTPGTLISKTIRSSQFNPNNISHLAEAVPKPVANMQSAGSIGRIHNPTMKLNPEKTCRSLQLVASIGRALQFSM